MSAAISPAAHGDILRFMCGVYVEKIAKSTNNQSKIGAKAKKAIVKGTFEDRIDFQNRSLFQRNQPEADMRCSDIKVSCLW